MIVMKQINELEVVGLF